MNGRPVAYPSIMIIEQHHPSRRGLTAVAILPRHRIAELGRPTLERVLCAVDGSRRPVVQAAPCSVLVAPTR